MLNDLSTPAAYLATRRSGKPRDLAAPGPDDAALARMLSVAARVPDHGKLAPWRFVVIDDRDAFAGLLRDSYLAGKPGAGRLEMEAVDQFAYQAPTLVAVLSTPREGHIPLWEQELSAGAACLALVAAAGAEGFAGGWLTGWAAYAPGIPAALGHPGARVAGFVFVGTPARPLEERPRPDMGSVVERWPPRPA